MFPLIVRPGVELSLVEERQAPALFAVVDRDRAHLRQWLPWVDGTREESDTLQFIQAHMEQFASNAGFAAIIWENGQIAGIIGTHQINWAHRRVELGYWLAAEFQGRGLITDSCRSVLKYLFTEMQLNRIEILCAVGNTKSKAVPTRLGFTYEGILREAELLNGQFMDLEVHSMLQSEFLMQREPRAAGGFS
jgi:ribosomal-protein-serine acetyltransferase